MRCWRWRPPGVVIFQLIDRLVQFGTRINCRPLRTNLLSLTLASASANFCFGAAFFFFGHCRPICRPITLQSYRSHFNLFCRRRPAAIKSRRTFHAVDISCFFFGHPKKKKKGRRLGSSQRDFLPLLQSDSISHYEGNCAPENRYISNFFFSTVCASHRNKHRPKDVTYVQVVGRCQRTRLFFQDGRYRRHPMRHQMG